MPSLGWSYRGLPGLAFYLRLQTLPLLLPQQAFCWLSISLCFRLIFQGRVFHWTWSLLSAPGTLLCLCARWPVILRGWWGSECRVSCSSAKYFADWAISPARVCLCVCVCKRACAHVHVLHTTFKNQFFRTCAIRLDRRCLYQLGGPQTSDTLLLHGLCCVKKNLLILL